MVAFSAGTLSVLYSNYKSVFAHNSEHVYRYAACTIVKVAALAATCVQAHTRFEFAIRKTLNMKMKSNRKAFVKSG